MNVEKKLSKLPNDYLHINKKKTLVHEWRISRPISISFVSMRKNNGTVIFCTRFDGGEIIEFNQILHAAKIM